MLILTGNSYRPHNLSSESLAGKDSMARQVVINVVLLYMLCVLWTCSSAKTYYVTPTLSTPCPDKGVPCFTLSQYAAASKTATKQENFFSFNATLILLNGIHSLDSELSISTGAFLNIIAKKGDSLSDSDTAIDCGHSAMLTIQNVDVVRITGLILMGCVKNSVTSVKQLTIEDCKGLDGTGLELNEVTHANIMTSSFSAFIGRNPLYALNYSSIGSLRGGAISVTNCGKVLISSCSFTNNVLTGDNIVGAAIFVNSSILFVWDSTFTNNSLKGKYDIVLGGSIYAQSAIIVVNNSVFKNNEVSGIAAAAGGAGLSSTMSNVTINSCIFQLNTVTGDYDSTGAAVYVHFSTVSINDSLFTHNSVTGMYAQGGAVAGYNSTITIDNSIFAGNSMTSSNGYGGALVAEYTMFTTTILNSLFINNAAIGDGANGGAVYFNGLEGGKSTLINNTFTNNTAAGKGAALYLNTVHLNCSGFLNLRSNTASIGSLYALQSTVYLSGNSTVSNNEGPLYFYFCNVTFLGYTNIVNNSCFSNTSQGAAVTGFQSEIVFTGTTNVMHNRAVHGGGIAAIESKVYVYGDITISQNTAILSGGGIYAYQSELNFKKTTNILRNSALNRGGGIHAISSLIKVSDGSKTHFVANEAKRGGGMCLERNAKLYIIKVQSECEHYCLNSSPDAWLLLEFTENIAEFGGAIYIADDTNSGSCSSFRDESTISSECFIQGLGLYQVLDNDLNTLNTYFTNNLATVAGNVLYGGLLDRCTVSPFAEIFQKYSNVAASSLSATSFILDITSLEIQDFNSTKLVTSDPVHVCFCRDNQPDCSYNPRPKNVKKGETFTVSLVAVDHVNNTIPNSTLHAQLVSLDAKLGEGQSIQKTSEDGSCMDFTYTILSPHNSEMLQLYSDGPCMNADISTVNLTVNIVPCPIGFKDTGLHCECDPLLHPEYISNCSIDSETLQRKDNVWFAYVNHTDYQGYMYHKHCPFDYCHPPITDISINLNIRNSSDTLCAYNRSGKLCGLCKEGHSLTFGSSRCMPCSNNWLALFTMFVVAGVVLVAFLLKCNLTVAVGTLNGLIFYANIIAVNRAILFPQDKTKCLTVFLAWLNLDFGFETCFYDGMNGYVKTWLQFAFPLYVIFLVVAIIVISDYSTKFAALFTGKNPIATLATLILLSYTKLLRIIIASLSFTTIEYSDGSHEVVWLVDANIPYLKGAHIPLFIAALVILIVGIMYTFLLFGWQWLVHCPNKGPLRWIIGNTKVIAFMDAYHNPYNKEHRYWIGMFLFVRALLYLVSALNVLGDPRINLLSINTAVVILLFFQLSTEYKHKIYVHKMWLAYLFEHISLLNLIGLTSITFYMTEYKHSQNVVAYISICITFVTFVAILIFHAITFVFKEQLQKIATTLCGSVTRPLVETAITLIPEEQEVDVTEFDGVPQPLESDTESDDDIELMSFTDQDRVKENVPCCDEQNNDAHDVLCKEMSGYSPFRRGTAEASDVYVTASNRDSVAIERASECMQADILIDLFESASNPHKLNE